MDNKTNEELQAEIESLQCRLEIADMRINALVTAKAQAERRLFDMTKEMGDVALEAANTRIADLTTAAKRAGSGAKPVMGTLVPDTACKQGKCARPTSGCWDKCHLQDAGYVVCATPPAAVQPDSSKVEAEQLRCRLREKSACINAHQSVLAERDAARYRFLVSLDAWVGQGCEDSIYRLVEINDEDIDAAMVAQTSDHG